MPRNAAGGRAQRSGRLPASRPYRGVLVATALLIATPWPSAAGGPETATEQAVEGMVSGSHPSVVPDDATLEANGAVIGQISIRAGEVFDPDLPSESGRFYRLANRLHRRTRDRVIRQVLLFRPGDRYSRRVLDESERLLRATKYIVSAEIRPVRYESGTVDVEVRTRDVWSLKASAGFGRSGGVNKTRIGIEDENFLGLGKQVSFKRTSNVDRTSQLYRYLDENLAGTRLNLQLVYANNSDGGYQLFGFERPFFSLDTRWAAGVRASSDDRADSLYDRGEITDRFQHRRSVIEVFAGRSAGLTEGRTRRWTFGATVERDRFDVAADFPSPSVIPPDRVLAYPWIELSVIRDGYIATSNLDRMSRTEDLNLGRQIRLRLGWLSPGFGADRRGAIFSASARMGTSPGPGQLVLVSGGGSGRWTSQGAENVRVGGEIRYYVRDLGKHLFFASLAADSTWNLDPELQLLLGGDSGLRGYPLRYQSGNRRLLLTLEQRFFTNWNLFQLVNVGGAVFFDAGRAWFEGAREANLPYLEDVGFGLRLSSNRSADAEMVHIDVAFPLGRASSVRSVQYLITTKNTF